MSGSSINVGERLNEHKKTSDIQAYSHLVLYANYAVVSDSTDRDNAEADLIRHYSPPANDVSPAYNKYDYYIAILAKKIATLI